MSRLDRFEEILKSYEGRECDTLALFNDCISSDACTVFGSFSPELQKKVLKYFDCVRQTGLIKWPSPVCEYDCVELIEANPDYFDNYLIDAGTLIGKELNEFSGNLEKILQLYKSDGVLD